jgi:acetyl/propionyl-CoA carboxylase alpha subunit
MKLALTVNGREEQIEILGAEPACRFRLGDGAERAADVESPYPGTYSVLLDGVSYDVFVEETPGGTMIVAIDGFRFEIEARDPRRWSRKSARRGGDAVQSLVSPMPGKVVRVLVAAGGAVEAGQGIVVVEAMKMQNELKAVRAGTVLTLPAKEGATVAAGELLATIE